MKKTTIVLTTMFALLLFGSLVFANPLNLKETRAEKPSQCFFSEVSEMNYDTWKANLEERNPRVLQIVTEENFETFKQMKTALINGDYEQANLIKEQLGLEQQQIQRKTMNQQKLQKQTQMNNNLQRRTLKRENK